MFAFITPAMQVIRTAAPVVAPVARKFAINFALSYGASVGVRTALDASKEAMRGQTTWMPKTEDDTAFDRRVRATQKAKWIARITLRSMKTELRPINLVLHGFYGLDAIKLPSKLMELAKFGKVATFFGKSTWSVIKFGAFSRAVYVEVKDMFSRDEDKQVNEEMLRWWATNEPYTNLSPESRRIIRDALKQGRLYDIHEFVLSQQDEIRVVESVIEDLTDVRNQAMRRFSEQSAEYEEYSSFLDDIREAFNDVEEPLSPETEVELSGDAVPLIISLDINRVAGKSNTQIKKYAGELSNSFQGEQRLTEGEIVVVLDNMRSQLSNAGVDSKRTLLFVDSLKAGLAHMASA